MEQGHITDRYTKAIEQLGKLDGDKPNIEIRLGAIYALERIARDSPRDHWTIMEVLTAYVRQNAPAAPIGEPPEKPLPKNRAPTFRLSSPSSVDALSDPNANAPIKDSISLRLISKAQTSRMPTYKAHSSGKQTYKTQASWTPTCKHYSLIPICKAQSSGEPICKAQTSGKPNCETPKV